MDTRISKVIATIASLCAFLAVAPYTIGEVALIIPPEWKPLVLKISLVSYIIGRLLAHLFGTPPPSSPLQK